MGKEKKKRKSDLFLVESCYQHTFLSLVTRFPISEKVAFHTACGGSRSLDA